MALYALRRIQVRIGTPKSNHLRSPIATNHRRGYIETAIMAKFKVGWPFLLLKK